jgi:hypothetical protein
MLWQHRRLLLAEPMPVLFVLPYPDDLSVCHGMLLVFNAFGRSDQKTQILGKKITLLALASKENYWVTREMVAWIYRWGRRRRFVDTPCGMVQLRIRQFHQPCLML